LKPGWLTPGLKAVLATLLSVLLWGSTPVFTRALVGIGHAGLPALPFVGLRYLIASLFFVVPLWTALRCWSRADLGRGVVCALIGITGYNLPSTLGMRSVTAGMGSLLTGTEPLFIVLLGAMLHRRLPQRAAMLAGLVGLAGIVILSVGAGPAMGDAQGIAWVLAASLSWSLYCVIVPPLAARRGALQVTAVTIAFGTLPMLLAGMPQMPAMLAMMTGQDWALMLVLTIGTSVIALLCWNIGAAGLGAERAGYFLYLLPAIGVLGGAACLAEPVTPIELAGGVLIVLSVYISQRRAR
jgi:drug/metabolite transporter (DMT)-like permease